MLYRTNGDRDTLSTIYTPPRPRSQFYAVLLIMFCQDCMCSLHNYDSDHHHGRSLPCDCKSSPRQLEAATQRHCATCRLALNDTCADIDLAHLASMLADVIVRLDQLAVDVGILSEEVMEE